MSLATFRFHLSHVQVELRCSERIATTARALWAGCRRLVDATVEDVYEIGDDLRIERNGEVMYGADHELDVVPHLQELLYARMHETRPPGVLFLHGAAVARRGRPVLLLGPSGSGKSTLALAAVRAGFDYLTDEVIGTDGARVWGVPRAIQFDATAAGERPPAWLGSLDASSYRLRSKRGAEATVPLWRPPANAVSEVCKSPASVVAIAHSGDGDGVTTCEAVDAVRAVHEAAHAVPSFDVGSLVGGVSLALRWRDPAAAWAEVATCVALR
jgi:hypothetical protein